MTVGSQLRTAGAPLNHHHAPRIQATAAGERAIRWLPYPSDHEPRPRRGTTEDVVSDARSLTLDVFRKTTRPTVIASSMTTTTPIGKVTDVIYDDFGIPKWAVFSPGLPGGALPAARPDLPVARRRPGGAVRQAHRVPLAESQGDHVLSPITSAHRRCLPTRRLTTRRIAPATDTDRPTNTSVLRRPDSPSRLTNCQDGAVSFGMPQVSRHSFPRYQECRREIAMTTCSWSNWRKRAM